MSACGEYQGARQIKTCLKFNCELQVSCFFTDINFKIVESFAFSLFNDDVSDGDCVAACSSLINIALKRSGCGLTSAINPAPS